MSAQMPLWQMLVLIGVMALGTLLLRAAPFLLFPAHKPTPRFVLFFGEVSALCHHGVFDRLLLKIRLGDGLPLWPARGHCGGVCRRPPSLAEEYAAEHWGGDDSLYGSGAGGVSLASVNKKSSE